MFWQFRKTQNFIVWLYSLLYYCSIVTVIMVYYLPPTPNPVEYFEQ